MKLPPGCKTIMQMKNPLQETVQASGKHRESVLSIEKGPFQASITNSVKYSDGYVSFCLSNKNKVI